MARKKQSVAHVIAQAKRAAVADEQTVRAELLAYWDADSPLTLPQLNAAYEAGAKLSEVGILSRDAEIYANKYNAIILRMPGKGPLVSGTQAIGYLNKKMQDIVKDVVKRATP